jgi:steroid 5-alpha reductase family enzyme
MVWAADDPAARALLHAAFGTGWLVELASTFLINLFDLFGLRQVWLNFRGRPYTCLGFAMPLLYRVVRHPFYVGWLPVFWATPRMTAAHQVFAAVFTTYILAAIVWEEREMADEHPEYAAYRRRVPILIPRWRGPAAVAGPWFGPGFGSASGLSRRGSSFVSASRCGTRRTGG